MNQPIPQPNPLAPPPAAEISATIHTMPKRYLHARAGTGGSHKKTGLLIILAGFLLLAGVLAALYYFVARPRLDAAKAPAEVSIAPEDRSAEELPQKNKETAGADKTPEADPAPVTQTPSAQPERSFDPQDYYAATGTPEASSTIREIELDDASPAPENSTGPSATQPSSAAVLSSDSDGDGLTDLEEMLLDCNARSADSDGDGYRDRDELLKLYNPAGTGQLIVNPNIEKYTNATHGYSLYYPETWLRTSADGDDSILFQAGSSQYIQIIVQAAGPSQTLQEWYKESLGADSIPGDRILYKAGWEGLLSPDSLVAYLRKPSSNQIFTISYNVGLDNTLRYKSIFEMIVESFELGN